MAKDEQSLYDPIKSCLYDELKDHNLNEFYVEITYNGVFSQRLRNRFEIIREIEKILPRKLMPDLTGFFIGSSIFVVEAKNDELQFEDIYQAKCYAELVKADVALLISPIDFSSSNRRVISRKPDLLDYGGGNAVTIGIFNEEKNVVREWYPRSPW